MALIGAVILSYIYIFGSKFSRVIELLTNVSMPCSNTESWFFVSDVACSTSIWVITSPDEANVLWVKFFVP